VSLVRRQTDTGADLVKVIEGHFGDKDEKLPVKAVFASVAGVEDLDKYEDAFCIVKSEDYVVISTNLDTHQLYFLLDQIKLTLITRGDYEI
jgi:hypothetical protein